MHPAFLTPPIPRSALPQPNETHPPPHDFALNNTLSTSLWSTPHLQRAPNTAPILQQNLANGDDNGDADGHVGGASTTFDPLTHGSKSKVAKVDLLSSARLRPFTRINLPDPLHFWVALSGRLHSATFHLRCTRLLIFVLSPHPTTARAT